MRATFVLNRALLCALIIVALKENECARHAKLLRNRAMLRRMGVPREERKPKLCYDLVGCFGDRTPHLALKRPPEPPSVIQTRFLLYTRQNRDTPDVLAYGDGSRSLLGSRFNASRPMKVIIHGYKGSGMDAGVISATNIFLDMDDWNILVLDWTKGAATTYAAAVANTELVGRQLGLVLLDAITLGTDPGKIHAIGFSLGAHIAGCASELLKKSDLLLGRITGLDPASPFFRNHLFRERARKLDASDASLVDVIHTDGSEDFADGFGLLKPIGHIDFFPNGGRQQPGCSDVKNAVVVSHLKDDALDRNIACSHLRAVALFVESIRPMNPPCRFTAWPCPKGGASYAKGHCFPMERTQWAQEMGMASQQGPLGIYYLATRGDRPFCGEPFRASVATADGAPKTKGTLHARIHHGNSTTTFRIPCRGHSIGEAHPMLFRALRHPWVDVIGGHWMGLAYTMSPKSLTKRKNDPTMFYNIAAVEYGAVTGTRDHVTAFLWYQLVQDATGDEEASQPDPELLLDKLALEDRKENRWEFCGPKTIVGPRQVQVELHKGNCTFA